MLKKIILPLGLVGFLGYYLIQQENIAPDLNIKTGYQIGTPIDSFNHVIVYYNGKIGNIKKRNTKDGYNLGLEYQCVEFVKRYYYEYLHHKMPDSYGHAKSFFDPRVLDGKINKQRNLKQFTNPSQFKPKVNDLIVMKATTYNRYGHAAIISKVNNDQIEIIQQNPGPFTASRAIFSLHSYQNGQWKIDEKNVLGWLRK